MVRVWANLRKLGLPGFKEPQRNELQPQEKPEHVVVVEPQDVAPSRSAEIEMPEPAEHLEFDEEWYLRRYPDVAKDVAKAIEEGRGNSGLQHYLAHGRREGRLPVPPKLEP